MDYIEAVSKNKKCHTEKACIGNQYLTDHEEKWLYQLIRVLGAVGHGVGRKEVLQIIDDICNHDEPEISRMDCSRHVLDGFWKNILILKMWWVHHYALSVLPRQLLTHEMQCLQSWMPK